MRRWVYIFYKYIYFPRMVLVSRMNTRISNEAGQWENLELKSIREKGMIIHQKAEKEQEPDPCKNKKKGWCYRSMCLLGWAFPQSWWVFAWRSWGTWRCWVREMVVACPPEILFARMVTHSLRGSGSCGCRRLGHFQSLPTFIHCSVTGHSIFQIKGIGHILAQDSEPG